MMKQQLSEDAFEWAQLFVDWWGVGILPIVLAYITYKTVTRKKKDED